MAVTGSVWLDFVVGFVVSLIGSIMNAAGLNLLKLDHVRNSARAHERQRHECGRPLWHVGLYLYISSQLLGSTIALNFLKTQWVAPLGSIALIFNFVFANFLVGTRITKKDVWGTIVVMISVVWIVVFGGMNSGADIEDSLTITELKALFSRVVFIIYFSILNMVVFALLALGMYAYWAISLDDESGQLRKIMKTKLTKLLGTNRFARASGLTLAGDEGLEAEARDLRLKKVVAMIMATAGGLLASQTLLLAKSGVKLIASTASGQNQFQDYLSFFILFVLVVTAILQVYCLNTALKLYDSVLVVPMFYGFYTAFGLVNSTIYLNQLQNYEPWVLFLILIGIGALIYGVRMLSAPKPELEVRSNGGAMAPASRDADYNDEDDEEGGSSRLQREAQQMGDSDDMFETKKWQKQKSPSLGSLSSSDEKVVSEVDTRTSSIRSVRRKSMQMSKIVGGSDACEIMLAEDEEAVDVVPPMVTGNRRKQDESVLCNEDQASGFSSMNVSGSNSGVDSILSRHADTLQITKALEGDKEIKGIGASAAAFSIGASIGASTEATIKVLDSQGHQRTSSDYRNREHEQKRAILQRKRSLPSRIDTSITTLTAMLTRGRSETRRGGSARLASTGAVPIPLSPSEFRAQYTDSPYPLKPKHLQEGGRGLGENCSGTTSPVSASSNHSRTRSAQTAHGGSGGGDGGGEGSSPRWATGMAKMDQVFEDLNPFKAFRRRSSVDYAITGDRSQGN
ncbi:hypothetical protein BGX28_003755, partial [Mortierella sp. GBA30]